MWFPRLPSDRALRRLPAAGPFALALRRGGSDLLLCLNAQAGALGLRAGMTLAEALAFCPELRVAPADPAADAAMLGVLRRWALVWAPRVAFDGGDGLLLDISGAAHLFGGETAMLAAMTARLERSGFGVRAGLADTPGAARALARYAPLAPAPPVLPGGGLPVAGSAAGNSRPGAAARGGAAPGGAVPGGGLPSAPVRGSARGVTGARAPVAPAAPCPAAGTGAGQVEGRQAYGAASALAAPVPAPATRRGPGLRAVLGTAGEPAPGQGPERMPEPAPDPGCPWAIAPPGGTAAALALLPVAALGIDPELAVTLERLGLARIGQLAAAARAPLARRFGQGLLDLLDRARGDLPDAISPPREAPRFVARLTLPEPIGLTRDVMAGLERLLARVCERLRAEGHGARELVLELRRVDSGRLLVPLRLAAPMSDPARILPLFRRGVETAEAGFGIDQLRLEAVLAERLPPAQTGRQSDTAERLENLVTRIGVRIGLGNIQRFHPVDSHIPERGFMLVPAASSAPAPAWPDRPRRPLTLFPPEPIAASGAAPPARFRWRSIGFDTGRAIGPERIAPEWWRDDPGWRRGLRDYWRIETRQGRRLWLFHTPQDPGWFVQGEFL